MGKRAADFLWKKEKHKIMEFTITGFLKSRKRDLDSFP